MRGHFGVGIYQPKTKTNVGTLFRSAVAFGAAYVFTVGRRYHRQASDTGDAAGQIPMYYYETIHQLAQSLPFGTRLVGVELDDKARPLQKYCHPERACLLLGNESFGLPPEVISICHELVVIDGASRCLNVATAGSIVMYDRVTKGVSRRPSLCQPA